MRKLLSAVLLFALIVSICSCGAGYDNGENPGENGLLPPDNDNFYVPEYKDYGRATIDFDKIEYVRPSANAVTDAYMQAKNATESEDTGASQIIEFIKHAENLAYEYVTLTSYAEIMSMKDITDTYWSTEFSYLSENRASVAKSAEELYVCCANSKHAEVLENEYFGDGFIEKYQGGGIFTDALVELMRQETELENEYSSLSAKEIVITYKNITGTYDEILAFYEEYFGKDSFSYKDAAIDCEQICQSKLSEKQADIFVELVKTRKLISDELGHESYLTYAYENIYHDYTPEQAVDYILDIPKYVLPVYLELSSEVFSKHFNDSECQAVTPVTVINDMYGLISDTDEELGEIYSYMLQHKLFDIEPESYKRFNGSFCTYLYGYDAPYMFITSSNSYRDYSTVAHEFGHFSDAYFNNGASSSLDLSEVSSQGLEYILLTLLNDKLNDNDYKALYYSEIEAAFSTLLFQGFYALFEHYIYQLEYDEISEDTLIECMKDAARAMGLNENYFETLSPVIIPHLMLYPTYVQSYCTSVSVSLELFAIETSAQGEGLKIYKDLVLRDEGDMTFTEYLSECGLNSPFESEYLRKIADSIYYEIVGSHYYKDAPSGIAA